MKIKKPNNKQEMGVLVTPKEANISQSSVPWTKAKE
jgi:hypothetical protein